MKAPVGELLCGRCQLTSPRLDGVRTYAFYTGPMRTAIRQFKYQGLYSLADPLAELMGKAWDRLAPDALEIDVIVPVPLHPARERERGYNQAALLARKLSAYLARPVVSDVLVRTRATAPQIHLSFDERRVNVHAAFKCIGDRLRGARVLLVDDVFTTGSTLEAACDAVRDGGAALVWAYTLARARLSSGDSEPI